MRPGKEGKSRANADIGSVISLFCGPGGFDAGFSKAGFSTLLAYDNDAASVKTHRRNNRLAKAVRADLSSLSSDVVVSEWRRRSKNTPRGVIGGPPCQSFSVSNVFQNGADPRHELPRHFARLIRGIHREFGLDFVVFENVPALASPKHEHRLRSLIRSLQRIGFRTHIGTLDAQAFGVPQVRPRLFVVGINRDRYPLVKFQFPKGRAFSRKTVADVIRNLPEPDLYTRKRNIASSFHPNHWCMRPRSRRFFDGTLQAGKLRGRSFRVLKWDSPSYTVAYGHREVHVHPTCKRRLSVLEAMLLQGFPRKYVFEGTLSDQIRLVSEAVSPPVAAALARAIRDQLPRQSGA